MNSHDITDRETLSALFDGELQGDARRFASRRLAHDTGWQEDCGRWQLMGDVMRRQAPIVAPADFAARLERAVAAEVAIAPRASTAPAAAVSPRRPARLWAGGALAASVALLAVFATRWSDPVTTATPALASAATGSPAAAPSAPAAFVDPAPASVASDEPPATEPAAAPSVQRVASVEPAAPRAVRRVPHVIDARPAVVAPQRAASAVLAAATFTAPDATNPFHVPAADPLASRPWPRAAVPAGGALTASYGTQVESRGDSPSFYPFEPRTHADAAVRAESP
jgi:negative regulator of sigma E activity